ncbi:MAG: 3-phosphoglycerate dehydrogenase family protein [Phycisphaerales bacterium]|jgi:D-3-phosphoglycerate dehydrogenase|nr:3-phosphoglycerate dehydrogenase family protein [Phycisphaerales bacterium]
MNQTMADTSTDQPQTATTSVLIADSFSDRGAASLRELGCDVHVDPSLSGDTLVEAVTTRKPHALIVRSTKVPEAVFEAADHLGLVVRAGAGYDTIDVAAASARGIPVANCPGMNAIAVAEIAWGLILSCDRRIPDQCADLRAGVWAKKTYAKAAGLYGRTLGVVGLGRIGEEVAARGRAFGMKVIAWSRSLTEESAAELGVEYCNSVLDLAARSDVVSLHVASTPDTRHLVNEAFCSAMKEGAILVNTTRGAVVDETALADAVQQKGLRVGLDVFDQEPGSGDTAFASAIVDQAGVYGTHHVGASTEQAQEAIAGEAARVLKTWVQTGEVPNCVNIASTTPASTTLTVRHLNRPGVLAHVFEVLGRSGQNIEEMENVIYEGGQAAVARIQIDGAVDTSDLDLIRSHDLILAVTAADIQPR